MASEGRILRDQQPVDDRAPLATNLPLRHAPSPPAGNIPAGKIMERPRNLNYQ